MFLLTFLFSAVFLSIVSVAFVAAFWWNWVAKFNPYLSLFVDLVLTSAFMLPLSIVVFLYSAGAFCPELLTTSNKCKAIIDWGWSIWLLMMWVPVMLYSLWTRFNMYRLKG